MASSKGLDSELESFRQQWLSEVRTKQGPKFASAHSSSAELASPEESKARPSSPSKTRKPAPTVDEQDAFSQPSVFDADSAEPSGAKELVSALDHFEEAMAKEAEGNMGDSLKLYRRAYRVCELSSA